MGDSLPNLSPIFFSPPRKLWQIFLDLSEEHQWTWMPHSVTEGVYWVQTMQIKERDRKARNARTIYSACQRSRGVSPSLTQTFKPPPVNHEAHFSHHITSSLTSEKESKLLTSHSLKRYWCSTIVESLPLCSVNSVIMWIAQWHINTCGYTGVLMWWFKSRRVHQGFLFNQRHP